MSAGRIDEPGRRGAGRRRGRGRVAVAGAAVARRPTGAPSCTADVDVDLAFGSLRSPPIHVVADDGVPLHVEVDEWDPDVARRRPAAHQDADEPP